MGCSSSHFLDDDDDDLGPGAFHHHIVSLTSTTYGLLTFLDHPPAPPKQPDPPLLERFEPKCPPGGEAAAVVYTTTLRGIRKTFDDCNSVRSALEAAGVRVVERDTSMHLGFRDELRALMAGEDEARLPRVFVKGRYIGGAAEVMRLQEEGGLVKLVEGLPKGVCGWVCKGCGGARFLPCFGCSGSCKVVRDGKVVRCLLCNENGLVVCPLCCC